MAEKETTKKLLWMFRNQSAERQTGEVDFDSVDAIYHLQKNTRNPYLIRTIAPAARKLDRTQEEAGKLVRVLAREAGYEVGPSNKNQPFTNRNLKHPPPPGHHQPQFQNAEKLAGDIYKLPWLINEFYLSVLGRLKRNPGEFDAVVQEILQLFADNKVRIKLYEAYHAFENWDDLMGTLEEISGYPSPETFDLFCSALFTYYELVYPPEEY